MSELLLELFYEEIPALMQKEAEEGYGQIFTKYLTTNNISYNNIKTFSTPRRITIFIDGLASIILSSNEEIKGPKVNSNINAIEGFCLNHKIHQDDLKIKKIGEHDFYFLIKEKEQQQVKEILRKDLPQLIKKYTWPKSMYWGDNVTYNISSIRPIRNIMCSFDNEVIEFNYGPFISNLFTYGHRFMSISENKKYTHIEQNEQKNQQELANFVKPMGKEILVNDFKHYAEELKNNFIILDREERKTAINKQIANILLGSHLTLKEDIGLLEEVIGLVEWPVMMIGKIDQNFLKLPKEILTTTMKNHQKYFSLFDKVGNFAPFFLFASNIVPEKNLLKIDPIITNEQDNKSGVIHDSKENENGSVNKINEYYQQNYNQIVQGNEKVLQARLADALYFYEFDCNTKLADNNEKLKQMMFHAKLGTMYDKTKRIEKICNYIAPGVKPLQEAARLCKADLVSSVVSELPELQGIAGYYYAINEGISTNVAEAIRDHYKPQGPNSSLPEGITGASLAIADKLDTIVGLFLIGEGPTSSKDPFAIRRAGLGIIRMISEIPLDINLTNLIDYTIPLYEDIFNKKDNINLEIKKFFNDRIRIYFKSDFNEQVINSYLDLYQDRALNYIHLLKPIFSQMKNVISSNEGIEMIAAYKRINNIYDGSSHKLNKELFKLNEEIELYKAYIGSCSKMYLPEDNMRFEDLIKSIDSLKELVIPINNFFDKVMVNDPDPELANNRMALLGQIKHLFTSYIINFDSLIK